MYRAIGYSYSCRILQENLETLEQDLSIPMDTEEAQTKILAATVKTMKKVLVHVQKLQAMDVDEPSPQEMQASKGSRWG
eukprot:COSAG05_NODE_3511_length_2018_cov_27.118564_2_plen_79_part_00